MAGTNVITHRLNDVSVLQRNTDGYFNATAMCQAADKRINNYLRNQVSKEYLEALSADVGIPISDLIQTLKGGSGVQGTWVHPKVAIHLAQWLSPVFAVQVTNWVHDWMKDQSHNPLGATASQPLASCTPIFWHNEAVLMLHQSKKDWVCFRSLCEAVGLDFKHHSRMSREAGRTWAMVEHMGSRVFCLTYQSAVAWLGSINPEKFRLHKRARVISAMMQLPKLLSEARDAYRALSGPMIRSAKAALPASKLALLEQLEKIEGRKLLVVPGDSVREFLDAQHRRMVKAITQSNDDGCAFLNTGYSVTSLRNA